MAFICKSASDFSHFCTSMARKNVLSGSLGLEDFLSGQVTSIAHFPTEHRPRRVIPSKIVN